MWRSLSGRPVADLVAEVRALLRAGGTVVHVGTDSCHRAGVTDFVTAVVVLHEGNGGRVFYRRQRFHEPPSLARRLFREVELSLAEATALEGALERKAVVHVDVSEDERQRSARFFRALSGMVLGHGFHVRVKPDAWCASTVADYVVNRRGGGRAA